MAENSLGIYKLAPKPSFLKAMIYGPPGVGKTTLGVSSDAVASMKDVLLMNIEGGTMPISNPEIYGGKEPVQVVDIHDFSKAQSVLEFLQSSDHNFKTVVVDSITELSVINIESITVARNRSDDKVFLEDYGSSTKQMIKYMRRLRNLPMNVIFIGHDAPTSQKDNASTSVALSPKLRRSVEQYMDFVFYMFNKTDKDGEKDVLSRVILTKNTGTFYAKERTPGGTMPIFIKNPTMSTLLPMMQGVVNK